MIVPSTVRNLSTPANCLGVAVLNAKIDSSEALAAICDIFLFTITAPVMEACIAEAPR
jgi:multisubunit Na+/H+ antiporter MnhG subunit